MAISFPCVVRYHTYELVNRLLYVSGSFGEKSLHDLEQDFLVYPITQRERSDEIVIDDRVSKPERKIVWFAQKLSRRTIELPDRSLAVYDNHFVVSNLN